MSTSCHVTTEHSTSYSFIYAAAAFLYRLLWFGDRKKKNQNKNKNNNQTNTNHQTWSIKQHLFTIFSQERGIWSKHNRGIPLFTIFILAPIFISMFFTILSNLVAHSASLCPTSKNNACFTRLLHISSSSQKLLNRATVTAQEKTNQARIPLNKYKLLIFLWKCLQCMLFSRQVLQTTSWNTQSYCICAVTSDSTEIQTFLDFSFWYEIRC